MSNVHALPSTGFAPSNGDIAKHLRELADYFEDGEDPLATVVILVEKQDGTLYRQTVGQLTDRARVVGLVSIMATRMAVE